MEKSFTPAPTRTTTRTRPLYPCFHKPLTSTHNYRDFFFVYGEGEGEEGSYGISSLPGPQTIFTSTPPTPGQIAPRL